MGKDTKEVIDEVLSSSEYAAFKKILRRHAIVESGWLALICAFVAAITVLGMVSLISDGNQFSSMLLFFMSSFMVVMIVYTIYLDWIANTDYEPKEAVPGTIVSNLDIRQDGKKAVRTYVVLCNNGEVRTVSSVNKHFNYSPKEKIYVWGDSRYEAETFLCKMKPVATVELPNFDNADNIDDADDFEEDTGIRYYSI